MAIQDGPNPFTGRKGNEVGRKLPNGKHVLQSYVPKIHNNHFPEQEANRNRMSIATILAARLGSVMDAAKPVSGYDCYAHNKLVGKIKRWVDSSECVGIFPAAMPLVAEPDIDVQLTSFFLKKEPAKVILHAELVPEQAVRLFRCAVAVIAYNETRNQWQSLSPMLSKMADVALDLPEQWDGDELHLAGYILPIFYSENGKDAPVVWGQVCSTFVVPQ